ncbi:hypothetical protein [Flavobacterium sp.]|uniref:hypothetical protein n=1 Tax=Flavobacterium sp. TaxID=239 RepID=UPI0040338B24
MKVLIYKRTHKGDPGPEGIFGIQDCMGKMRNWNYDAVIGIGGKASWRGHEDIRYKINWIGLGPKKIISTNQHRGPGVVFTNFALFEAAGQDIETNFPHLFKYMYDSRKRFDMSSVLPENVYLEVMGILNSAESYTPSQEYHIENIENHPIEDHNNTKRCTGCFRNEDMEMDFDQDYRC